MAWRPRKRTKRPVMKPCIGPAARSVCHKPITNVPDRSEGGRTGTESAAGRQSGYCLGWNDMPRESAGPANELRGSQTGHKSLNPIVIVTKRGLPTPMSGKPITYAPAKLLLAEDEPSIRLVCALVLRNAGYRVVEAVDGLEALAVCERENPDLLILDVNMPRLNGWKTIERLKQQGSRRPVLMLTGLNEVSDRVRGL